MSEVNFWDEEQEVLKEEKTSDTLRRYAEEVSNLEKDIFDKEDFLDSLKERKNYLLRTLIPTIMESMGLEEIKLQDKTKIKVDIKVNASISKSNEREAFEWLEQNDFGGLIKSKISVEFGKGDSELAKEALEVLSDNGIDAALVNSIHAQTLKSFVKEQLSEGRSLPECISIFEYKEAKISLPKIKK